LLFECILEGRDVVVIDFLEREFILEHGFVGVKLRVDLLELLDFLTLHILFMLVNFEVKSSGVVKEELMEKVRDVLLGNALVSCNLLLFQVEVEFLVSDLLPVADRLLAKVSVLLVQNVDLGVNDVLDFFVCRIPRLLLLLQVSVHAALQLVRVGDLRHEEYFVVSHVGVDLQTRADDVPQLFLGPQGVKDRLFEKTVKDV